MGKGSRSTTQTTTAAPWANAQPLLNRGLAEAERLFDAGDLTPTPFGNRLAGQSAATTDAQAMIEQQARAGTGIGQMTADAYQNLVNPYDNLAAVKEQALRDTMPAAASYFANSGMLNSSVGQEAMAETAARAIAPIEYNAYNQASNRGLQAMSMAPMVHDMQFADAQTLGQLGQGLDTRSQMELDEQARAYYEDEDNAYQNLGRITNIGMGFGSAGGTQTGVGTQPGMGAGGILGTIFQGAGAIAPFFSDRRLKSNIKRIGTSPRGYPWYEFDLFGQRQEGVMSDEVPADIVYQFGGYDVVDYARV